MTKPLILAALMGATFSIAPIAQAQFPRQATQSPAWAQPAAGTLLPESIQGLWLTQAEVTNVKEEQEGFRSTLKVTYVYCGSKELIGKTFSAYSPKSGVNWNGLFFIPVMQLGEKGIFVVKYARGLIQRDEDLAYTRNNAYGYDFPIREKGNANFDEAQIYAEAVERVCKAKPDDQIKLLQSYAVSQRSKIAAWAIHSLSAMQPDKTVAFLENLSDKKLPIQSLLAVDDVLLRLQEKKWPGSKARVKLLQTLIDSKLDDAAGMEIVRKLDASAQSGGIEETQLFQLLKAIVNSHGLPLNTRRFAVGLVGTAAERGRVNKHDAVAALLKWIEEPIDEDIRVAAAYTIANALTLSKEQVASVRFLKKQVADDKLVVYLQKAIDRAEKETP